MEIAHITQSVPSLVRDLVHRYGNDAIACQITNPGIAHWHNPENDAIVGYISAAGYRVVASGPLCPAVRLPAVITAFEADARRTGQRVCYFGAGQSLIDTLDVPRHARMLLGAQPVWDPHNWPAIVARRSSLRSQIKRLRSRVTVELWDAARAGSSADLMRCRREWLAARPLPPMRFVVETDVFDYLEGRRVYVAEQAGRPVAFLVAVPVPGRSGWLIDQLIRGAEAPNGAMEVLIDAAMRDLAGAGAGWVSLGLSPLSRRAGLNYSTQPAWMRLTLALTRRLGRPFYNFDGLDAFKARLQPDAWEPLYAVERPMMTPLTIYAIATAFGADNPLRFVLRGCSRLMRQS